MMLLLYYDAVLVVEWPKNPNYNLIPFITLDQKYLSRFMPFFLGISYKMVLFVIEINCYQNCPELLCEEIVLVIEKNF